MNIKDKEKININIKDKEYLFSEILWKKNM